MGSKSIKKRLITGDKEQLADFVARNPDNARAKLLEQFDDLLIEVCMENYGANQTRLAKILGVNRGSMRKRMKNLGYIQEIQQ
ncbi:helix-turn-helix domain-containing protein [Acinetobacter schindleri]|uniref:DNA binding HTH domain-containing protein n=1 Tax=Acinetobacter schindleri NIPH 900 TaxID=1217675 RepID=N8Y509_9GAMM|nr:helix-turn-helix domain-containing protein [Acinetobacter schindleri]ENV14698.1 hypothetical protein F965_00044 [Acinetobacter schindleri NIPH 900]